MENKELYNLTDEVSLKFLGIVEENGNKIYKYEAVSIDKPNTKLFSVSSMGAIDSDNINKNKLVQHISNSLSNTKSSEINISKSNMEEMIKVPYEKDSNNLFKLTDDIAIKKVETVAIGGEKIYKYEAVSTEDTNQSLFEITSQGAINKDTVNKNKLAMYISENLNKKSNSNIIELSKKDVKEMTMVPYKKDTQKLFKLTDDIAVKQVEEITVGGEKTYKYEIVPTEDTNQSIVTIYSPKKLQDSSIDKNKLIKYISDTFEKNANTKEISLKKSDVNNMKVDKYNNNKNQAQAPFINIVDVFKFDEGKKIINNMANNFGGSGFTQKEYNGLKNALSDVPSKYSYLGDGIESALEGIVGKNGFSVGDIIANTSSVINEQFEILLNIISSSRDMQVETGEISPDIDAMLAGETQEEYSERFKKDYQNKFVNRKFNSFNEYFEEFGKFMYDYTAYSTEEVKTILEATEVANLNGLTDEQIETPNQLYEMRNSIAELVGIKMGLSGEELEKFMSSNADILTDAIKDTNILNGSNSSVKDFLYQITKQQNNWPIRKFMKEYQDLMLDLEQKGLVPT